MCTCTNVHDILASGVIVAEMWLLGRAPETATVPTILNYNHIDKDDKTKDHFMTDK